MISYYVIGLLSFIVGIILTYLLLTRAYRRALNRLIQEINLKNVVIDKLKLQLKTKDNYIYDKAYKSKNKNEKSKR